jgi:hypothetical protein
MITSCFLNAYSVVILYRIAGLFFTGPSGRFVRTATAAIYAFFPVAVFWSATNLKDPIVTFILILALESILRLMKKISLRYLAIMTACLFLMTYFRFYYAVLLTIVAVFSVVFLSSSKRNPAWVKLGAIGMLVAAGTFFEPLQRAFLKTFSSSVLEIMSDYYLQKALSSTETALTATSFGAGYIMQALPVGIARIFLSPVPTKLGENYVSMLPGVMLNYFLLPFIFYGIFLFPKKNFRYGFPVYTTAAAMAILISIVQLGGNTIRIMSLYSILVFFGALGIAQMRTLSTWPPLVYFFLAFFIGVMEFGFKYGLVIFAPMHVLLLFILVWLVFFARLPGKKRGMASSVDILSDQNAP